MNRNYNLISSWSEDTMAITVCVDAELEGFARRILSERENKNPDQPVWSGFYHPLDMRVINIYPVFRLITRQMLWGTKSKRTKRQG